MCGIFAYLNYDTPVEYKSIMQTLSQALKILELKGYDSAGVGISDPASQGTKLRVIKTAGTVEKLNKLIEAADLPKVEVRNHVAMAHTRWATHGLVNDQNAHPHPSDSSNEFIVCHNGMINNYADIKANLEQAGHKFETDTDTEVIAKLAKHLYNQDKKSSFGALVRSVCKQLDGAFALAFMSSHYPNEMVVTSYGSSLFLGVNMYDRSPPPETRRKVGLVGRTDSRSSLLELARASSSSAITKAEYFISSEQSCLSEHTKTCIELEAGDLLHFRNGKYQYFNFKEGTFVDNKERPVKEVAKELKNTDKGKYAHYMLKEIFDQPESLHNVMRGRVDFEKNSIKLGGIEQHVDEIRYCRRILFIASASSYHAAVATRGIFEELTGLAVNLELSTDFIDRSPSVERNDACVFISQSGETKDVLKAVEYCKNSHALCIGITNTVGSPLSKMTDCGIYLNCGPEIGVASTKVYTSEIVALTLVALKLGDNTTSTQKRREEIIGGLKALPDLVTRALERETEIKKIAETIKDQSSVLVMGRGWQYATCLEGALKLKEISSLHSEGVLSGELKHGPLALVDKTMPIVFVATKDRNYDNIRNAFSQVTAREGHPIVICSEGDTAIPKGFDKIEIPTTVDCLQCVLNIIPMQLLSYHVALLRGLDVDFSRSLAKVVTV